MKNIVLYLFLLGATSFNLLSQSFILKGDVIFVAANEPLYYSTVSFVSEKDSFNIQTKDDGDFEIYSFKEGRYKVKVSFQHDVYIDTSLYIDSNTKHVVLNVFSGSDMERGLNKMGYNKTRALYDIKSNDIRLVFSGGMISTPRAPFDRNFEKKYNLKLAYPGCVSYDNENREEYNLEVFSFLDSVYGLEWRDDLRRGIVGFSKYLEILKSDTLVITALNLSEDMSVLSTKNDEIFVFAYELFESKNLCSPLISEKLIFDKNTKSYKLAFEKRKKMVLFLIEEDSFRGIKEIEPVVRLYYFDIMTHKSNNESKVYLGEDDLLGTKIINQNTSAFTISGMSSLDKYEYSFEIK